MDDSMIDEERYIVSSDCVRRAILPLTLIFWGGLICVFEISFSAVANGSGFKFDILNDAVGMIMITVGVFRLLAIPVHSSYQSAMKFVSAVSVVCVVDAIRDHFVVEWPAPIEFALFALGMVALAATLVFCVAMRWFCEEAGLFGAVRSWKVTTTLFLVIHVVPLGLFYLVGCVALASGESFRIDLGAAGLLLLPVFAAPIIHLFVSTMRMKRSAQHLPPASGGGPGPRPASSNAGVNAWWLVLIGSAGFLVLLACLLYSLQGLVRQRAYCMCSSSGILRLDEEERRDFMNYLNSDDFILTILERKPKFAPLIAEAKNFWHPTITESVTSDEAAYQIQNNNVRTNFDRSYQSLFMDLRKDIYAELWYQEGVRGIKSDNRERIRSAMMCLDVAGYMNSALDIEGPLQRALVSAGTEEKKAILTNALAAARSGVSLEDTFRKASAGQARK